VIVFLTKIDAFMNAEFVDDLWIFDSQWICEPLVSWNSQDNLDKFLSDYNFCLDSFKPRRNRLNDSQVTRESVSCNLAYQDDG